VDNLFKACGNSFVQHFSPVFRTENNVILARVHDVSIRLVLQFRRHVNSISRLAVYYQSGGCLLSPGLKPGGLRHFC
jgi:hypothetical protein